MSIWQIQARKYDNSLHYTMPAHLLHDDGEQLLFRVQPGEMIHHFTRGWIKPVELPSEMFFWRGRWYNIYVNYTIEDAALRDIYCNVGLPPVIDGQTISYVDLDLDVQFWPDGRCEVLDEDEFIEHTVLYDYPQQVQSQAWKAVDDLLGLWRTHTPPMDRLFNEKRL